MKFKFDKKYLYWGLTAFLALAGAILFYYLLFHRSNFMGGIRVLITIAMPIIDGFVLAYLFTPILNKIEKSVVKPLCKKAGLDLNAKNKSRIRAVCIFATLLVVILILYELFALIIPEVIRSIQSIIYMFPVYLNNLSDWALLLLKDNPDLEATVNSLFEQYSSKITDFATHLLPRLNDVLRVVSTSVIGVVKALWNLVIGFIISIYLLGSKEKFAGQAKKIVYAIFDRETGNEIVTNFRFIHSTFIGFLGGKIVDSIIIGILCFICTSIIGTPYSILVSVIVGVTNIIPFFGPWIGGIPSALLVLMVDPKQALYFGILVIVIQQFDGNILGPKILGDSTGLSGFWVIFAITIFGGIFGVPGMVVGVPIFAVFYAGVKSVVNRSLHKKNLPTDLTPYMTVGQIEESMTFTEYIPPVKKKNRNKTASQTQKNNAAPPPDTKE
ncbi:MAG: AI-2E family transporter [Bacteroidales bacterium]|nr:AI-2E family transporter [Bacteroidales bacterium]MCM1414459.1 AI-2E family transporter [bacterium]MCM1422338.1 AI-2E family transporter [bacterium]